MDVPEYTPARLKMTRPQQAAQFQRLASAYHEAQMITMDQLQRGAWIMIELMHKPRGTNAIAMAVLDQTLHNMMAEWVHCGQKARQWYGAARAVMDIE